MSAAQGSTDLTTPHGGSPGSGVDAARDTAAVDRSEGDINATSARANWRRDHVSETARALLQRDAAAYVHQALSTPCMNALSACAGSWITDVDGRRYLDFHGNSAHQVGYGHPRVVEAIKRQLDTLPFCPRRYANEPAVELAEALSSLTGHRLSRVLLAPSGAVAVSTALKIARLATGRKQFISMWGSFHGATLDAISVGGEAIFRDTAGPLMPGVIHVPPSRPERCSLGCDRKCGVQVGDESGMRCAEAIENALSSGGDVAGVIAEPIRCTTVSIPPPAYWKRVRELCDRSGALLIFDEIPTCLGRTGKMFAYEHFGIVPDVLVIGKGLGGGIMPLAATLVRDGLVDGSRTALGHYTHEKSPVASAAALATIRVIIEDQLVERSAVLGERIHARLCELKKCFDSIADVRGRGLLLAVEIAARSGRHEDATAIAEHVMYAALARGLNFKVSDGNVLTLTPPLTLTDDEAEQSLDILAASLRDANVVFGHA